MSDTGFSAELSTSRRKAEAKLSYAVTGAEDREVGWGQRGMYRPAVAEVLYRMADHRLGTRIQMVADSVVIIGYRVKKDGTAGRIEVREWFPADQMSRAPKWAADLLKEATGLMEAADEQSTHLGGSRG